MSLSYRSIWKLTKHLYHLPFHKHLFVCLHIGGSWYRGSKDNFQRSQDPIQVVSLATRTFLHLRYQSHPPKLLSPEESSKTRAEVRQTRKSCRNELALLPETLESHSDWVVFLQITSCFPSQDLTLPSKLFRLWPGLSVSGKRFSGPSFFTEYRFTGWGNRLRSTKGVFPTASAPHLGVEQGGQSQTPSWIPCPKAPGILLTAFLLWIPRLTTNFLSSKLFCLEIFLQACSSAITRTSREPWNSSTATKKKALPF